MDNKWDYLDLFKWAFKMALFVFNIEVLINIITYK